MSRKYQFDESDLKLFQDRVATKREQKFNSTWVIKVNGEVYVTSSGKCGWQKLGHAKSALKLDLSYIISQIERKKQCHTNAEYKQVWDEYIQHLVDLGILEFVEVN